GASGSSKVVARATSAVGLLSTYRNGRGEGLTRTPPRRGRDALRPWFIAAGAHADAHRKRADHPFPEPRAPLRAPIVAGLERLYARRAGDERGDALRGRLRAACPAPPGAAS